MAKNTFIGEDGLNSFLNPLNHITPLVELASELNPFLKDKVHIYIKMQNFLPLMNVKSLAAYNMITSAELEPEATNLVESSSGNTAFSVGIMGRRLGFKKTRATVSSEVSVGKTELLLLAGVEVEAYKEPICPVRNESNNTICESRRIGKKKNWYNLNQYANANNPRVHLNHTGAQIYDQLQGNVQLFCTGLGTAGTMVGTSQYLKGQNPEIKTVGVVRKPNSPVPGPRTYGQLQMVDIDWQNACDEIIAADMRESYEKSMLLFRHGIMAGPSTGFSFAGLLHYLRKMKASKKLDSLRDRKGDIHAVFICCDAPFIYLDDYFKVLPRNSFPNIMNEELMKHKVRFAEPEKEPNVMASATKLKSKLKDKKAVLIDVRNNGLFESGHIAGFKQMSEDEIIPNAKALIKKWKGKEIYFLCQYGDTSAALANMFAKLGTKAYFLEDGFASWKENGNPVRYAL